MKLTRHALTLIAAAAVLAGCASNVKLDEPAKVETAQPKPPVVATQQPPKPAETNVPTVDLFADYTRQVQDKRVVYFDFDSDVVKEEYRPLIDLHAKRLNANKKAALNLEGHTDERGGREYNLALGQKRAEAVQKSLTLLGVSADQVEAVSFGEERPAAQGSTEEAWAQNRRAEIKDR